MLAAPKSGNFVEFILLYYASHPIEPLLSIWW